MTPKLTALALRRWAEVTSLERHAEDLAGDERVDVVVAFEGGAHGGVLRVVGEDAQLDLRVVGGEQLPAGLAGDEGRADFAAFLGADRDVLQVRVAGAEPAGGGDDLVERRVDAARFGVDHRRQRVDVRVLELRELAVLDDLRRQRMRCGQLFEHVGVGARAGLCFLDDRQAELLEQHLGELLRRADVERMAGEFFDFLFELREPLAVAGAQSARRSGSMRMPMNSRSASTSISGTSTVFVELGELHFFELARRGSAAFGAGCRRLRRRRWRLGRPALRPSASGLCLCR